ncbi:bifunctional Calcineurin B protein/Fibronectin type II domain/Fibronectin type II domain superfamily/PA14 domain/EF-Hand 1 [Babesia duncani]|uniref:Bifunctional Calcineurin B protein/Fibronectin type II domain/Fibronectin type II domain superfamily/PA14 domain/EF-Hand 1 n=1 Tax=Babesia duncani TaxID=323732 RepID=A0AAD9PHA4_9APIC|nr:bifunctional Calcineurin B protein/Fibronectin type II domain/Fibronectin type II domain superfamily/PA14 domain/EF-Hand 1 [Babesia duncani]
MGKSYSCMDSYEKRTLIQAANFDEAYVKRLYKRFTELDVNNTGSLPFDIILNMSEMKHNPLAERIVEVFDIDSDGTISFTELLFGLAKLTNNAAELEKSKFVFDIYDYNKDGYISNGDLFKTIKLMVGENLTDIQVQQLVDRAIISGDKDGDGMLSFQDFIDPTENGQEPKVALPKEIEIPNSGEYDKSELQKLTEFRQQHRKTVDGALCAAAFVRNGKTFTDCTKTEAPDGSAGREWCYVEAQLVGTGFRDWDFCAPIIDYDMLRAKARTLANLKAMELANGIDELAKEERYFKIQFCASRRLNGILARYDTVCGTGAESYNKEIQELHVAIRGIERAIEQLETSKRYIEQLRHKENGLKEQLEAYRKYTTNSHKNCAMVRGYHQSVVGDGIIGSYYDNPFFRGTPKGFIHHGNVNLIWNERVGVDGVPIEAFSVRLEGFLRAPATDLYTFYIEGDCNVRMFLDKEEIMSQGFDNQRPFDKDFGPVTPLALDGRAICNVSLKSRAIKLVGGTRYYIVVEYSHQQILKPYNPLVAKVMLSWSSTLKPHWEPIPSRHFFRGRESPESLQISGLKAKFYSVGILENGAQAFKDSANLVLADIPQRFRGATMIRMGVEGITDDLKFHMNRDANVYVSQPHVAPDVPKTGQSEPFEKSAFKLSVFAVGESCGDEAIRQEQFVIYHYKFKAGNIEIKLPSKTSLVVFIMAASGPEMCQGDVEYLPMTRADTCTSSSSQSDSKACTYGFGSGVWESAPGRLSGQYITRHFGSVVQLHHFHLVPGGGVPPSIVKFQFPDGESETFEIDENLYYNFSKPRMLDWVRIDLVHVSDSKGVEPTTGGSFALYGIACPTAVTEPTNFDSKINIVFTCGASVHESRYLDSGRPKARHDRLFYGWDNMIECKSGTHKGILLDKNKWSIDIAQHGIYKITLVVTATQNIGPISILVNGYEIFGAEYLKNGQSVTYNGAISLENVGSLSVESSSLGLALVEINLTLASQIV